MAERGSWTWRWMWVGHWRAAARAALEKSLTPPQASVSSLVKGRTSTLLPALVSVSAEINYCCDAHVMCWTGVCCSVTIIINCDH